MADFTSKTIETLGAIISAPKLSEKLLSKPPFRFLHDVVTNYMKATSFPEGLYPEDMLDSSKVTEKEAKIEFLRLLIAAVEAATGVKCEAKPSKIIAGQEPENTNQMLQLLASCASLSKEAKDAAVQKAKGGDATPQEKPKETEEERQKRKDEERRKRKEKEAADEESRKRKEREANEAESRQRKEKEAADEETRKRKEKEAESRKRKEREAEEERKRRKEKEAAETESKREAADEMPKETEEERRQRKDEERRKRKEKEGGEGETEEERRQRKDEERRKRKEKEAERDKEAQRKLNEANTAMGLIREAKPGEEANDDAGEEDWQKVVEKLEARPTAGIASTADASSVKGALGQQALQAKLEQEAQQRQEEATAAAPSGGGIVIRSSKSAGQGRNLIGENDLNKLREQLQLLTKASNPLGKFLEVIYDDVDSMVREMEMWRSESRNQALGAADARRQTEESLQEIHAQLQHLDDDINEQIAKTNHLRQSIIASDSAMDGMIRMIVHPEVGRS